MIKLNYNFEKHYLNESNKLNWYKKPTFAVKKNKNNHYSWFPDGKINIYENCITKNLKKKKIAIITVDKKKKFKKYTFEEIDIKVKQNFKIIYLILLRIKK